MTLSHSRREWLMGASNALGAALLAAGPAEPLRRNCARNAG